MWYSSRLAGHICALLSFFVFLFCSSYALAVQPEAKTVPWVPSNPLLPHDAVSGEATRLKGTSSVQGATIEYSWNPGDGSPLVVGTVTNQYSVEATHTYTGAPGTVFTATLTLEDTSTGESDSANYFVALQSKTLETEVNIAIDEGLWYLHKTMVRSTLPGPAGSMAAGWWTSGFAGSNNYSNTPSNLSAFLVNGHNYTNASSNPYTETVERGMRGMFNRLTTSALPASQTNPVGTFNPDTNGNGVGVRVNQGNEFYQGGMFMDAIAAMATPGATVDINGPLLNRTHQSVLEDMGDYYNYCQYDGTQGGGWRYSCNAFPDGSAIQWAAIGMIAAERLNGYVVPGMVKAHNVTWISFAQAANGSSGYTSTGTAWGPYATTPSGTVQMVWNGIGRGNATWDLSEGFLRTNFCNASTSPLQNIREYYYGLFSFTKSMLLHDANGDQISEPIAMLGTDLDWYGAQASAGDLCDGVARTLVDDQNAAGYWRGNDFSSTQYSFETGWAIVMLNRTVFASGVPVAVATPNPNPAIAGQTVNLSGANSFHQNPSRNIVTWEWDLDNDGAFDDASGVTTSTSFPVIGDYPVGLRVCDDGGTDELCDDTIEIIRVTTPPIAPTADANGPYVFCPAAKPWFLDGTGSSNPDEGGSEPGQPGDTIQSWEWELNGDNAYDDALGAQPNVTAFYEALGTGDYNAQLRVTDTTATSYPSSNFGDLSDTDLTQVSVRDAADPACSCVDNLAGRPKRNKIQLTWADSAPAGGYNVYRSTVAGGPYSFLANTSSSYSTYLDSSVAAGNTYFYVVRPADLAGKELCQSNEAMVDLASTRRR
jgi:PKD domain